MYKIKLMSLGLKPHFKGFEYTNEAIKLYHRGMAITGENGLYQQIANMYDDTPSRVERAIRYAIAESKDKLSNSQFIAKYQILWGQGEDIQHN